jgi:hypothetical protein
MEGSGNVQGTMEDRSGNNRGMFREQSRNVQRTFREHSLTASAPPPEGDMRGTFREQLLESFKSKLLELFKLYERLLDVLK